MAKYELAKVTDLLPEDVAWEDLKENLEDLGDDVPIPKIRFSSAEAAFYFNEDDEDEEPTKEFTGVILAYHRQNTYWSTGYDPSEKGPPECVSLDNKTGSVYGNCKSCTFNQFGSAPVGKGKACRNQIKLYIQLEGRAIPQRLFLSPANLRAFTNAFMVGQVSQAGTAYWKVKTKFTAYKNKKENFGRIKLAIDSLFKGDDLKEVAEIRKFWGPIIESDHYSAGDFSNRNNDDDDDDNDNSTSKHDTSNEDTIDMGFDDDSSEDSSSDTSSKASDDGDDGSDTGEAGAQETSEASTATKTKPKTVKAKPKQKKVEVQEEEEDDDVPF